MWLKASPPVRKVLASILGSVKSKQYCQARFPGRSNRKQYCQARFPGFPGRSNRKQYCQARFPRRSNRKQYCQARFPRRSNRKQYCQARFPGRSNRKHCCRGLATATTFLRSCVVQALSRGNGSRHSVTRFGVTPQV